jgi:hypothetical protein
MTRLSPVSPAVIALMVLFVSRLAAVAFSGEKAVKDYKDLEGKEWAASDAKYGAPRGWSVTKLTIRKRSPDEERKA